MHRKTNDAAAGFPWGWLIDLAFLILLFSLIHISAALAAGSEDPSGIQDQAQQRLQPEAKPGEVPATAQGTQTAGGQSSLDFLMGGSPLSAAQHTPAVPGDPDAMLDLMDVAPPLPPRVPPAIERPDEVAVLLSEQCSREGAGDASSCQRVYSNGHHSMIRSQSANEGDETKLQTVVEEFDRNDILLFRKTIRHRVDYNYLNDQKTKEKEFFDIIYQPSGRKTTRELMIYEYFLDTGKERSLSWAQYEQIGSEAKAGLVFHTLLKYGSDGNPERGLAERWDSGKKAEVYIDWNRNSEDRAAMDPETWQQWEKWVKNFSLQAYLP